MFRLMDTAIAVGFATTGATLLVTVVLFAIDRCLQRKSAREAARREMVARVLRTFEGSMRTLARPVLVRAWQNPDLEFTLLIPRLLVDLPSRDRVIAKWLLRQVQLMRLAVTTRERVAIGAHVGQSLVRWQHREIKARWFTEQLATDPLATDFRVPTRTRVRQVTRDSWAWAQLLGLLAAVGMISRQVVGAKEAATHER